MSTLTHISSGIIGSCAECQRDYNLSFDPAEDCELHTWFERDRQHVELRLRGSDDTLIEFWDDAVTQAVEDGYLEPSDWFGSLCGA